MLELLNINKTFNPSTLDETVLFDNYNLSVTENEFVSIIGSNGSGKTTLLNIICGSDNVTSGSIKFNGSDITVTPEYKRAAFIGRVLQDPKSGTCSDLTILENMALSDNKNKSFGLSRSINKNRIDYYKSLLEKCNMGLENKINIKTSALSGGQRQALALILANMNDISLLILDEHTAALDPKSSESIMQLTDKLIKEKNITTIMVTHNLRYAVDFGTRLVMMHEGKNVLDLCEEQKAATKVDDLLGIFNNISIEMGN